MKQILIITVGSGSIGVVMAVIHAPLWAGALCGLIVAAVVNWAGESE